MTLITAAAPGAAAVTLRGGRITKWCGKPASCAPQVSTIAIGAVLGAALLTPSAAQAGTCVESPPGSLEFECSGPENASTDVTLSFLADAGESLLIETVPGFGLAVAGGPAFDIGGAVGSGTITFRDVNNDASRILGRGGILINHNGTGAVDVAVSARVEASPVGDGIAVDSRGSGIRIAAREVSAPRGINVIARGTGDVTISSTGAITGTVFEGIYAATTNSAGALTITTNDITGGTAAIRLAVSGSGNTSVTTTGVVTGGSDGIAINDLGAGDIAISTSGDVTGTGGSAIAVTKDYGGARLGNIAINAVNTSGGVSGIAASQQGNGELSITSTGRASGASAHGISANSYGGAVTITSQEAVGANGGIRLTAFGGTGAASVTSHTATGGQSGINAFSASRDGLTITTTGATTGTTGTGLSAFNSSGNVVINAQGAVSGGMDGIFGSTSDGNGTLTITASAPVTGTARHGIAAYAERNPAARIEITAGDVSGGESAIMAHADQVNGIAITLSGTAQGGSKATIDTMTGAGALSMISITDTGGALAGASGVAIRNNAGNSLINVAGTINGDVRLGDGSDTLNIASTAFLQSGAVLDGGDTASAADGMVDVLSFNGWSGLLMAGNLVNWEAINLNMGTSLRLSGGGALVTGDAGNAATGLFVNAGATLDLAGVGLTLTGNLFNDGTITLANGTAGDVLAISGDYTGGGNGLINLDTNFFTNVSDRMTVGGSVFGGITTLGITNVSTGAASGADITLVAVQGASPAGRFMLSAGPITVDGFAYSLEQVGGNWALTALCTDPAGCAPPPPPGTIVGDLSGDPANPVIAVTGDTTVTGTVSGGATGPGANNIITIDTTGTVGAVAGDAGDDQIWLLGGTVLGNVEGGGGDDRIMLNGGIVAGVIDAGEGDNTVNLLAGSAGAVAAGAGEDVVQLAGAAITGALDTGAGDDTIVLLSGSAGSVLSGAGNDTLDWNAAAATTTLVEMGVGNDVLNINDAVIDLVGVVLDGGTGDNTLNLNNAWSGTLAGANTLGWQTINLNGGTLFVSDGAISAGTLAVNGSGVLNGSNNLVVDGNLALGAGATLIAGNNTGTNRPVVRGDLVNGGTIDLRSPTGVVAAGDILTIEGDYITLANSLRLDAVLGAGQLSDEVIVRGDLVGSGTVIINNAGGTGSLTTGDGIRLVGVDGSSAGGNLTLAGGTIDVGAFRYALFEGGIADPNDQDWYLRSRARDIVLPTLGMARIAQDLGLAALGTFNERAGEQARIGAGEAATGWLTGTWLRAFGKDGPETITSAAFGDTRTDARMGGLQMGVDVYRSSASDGSHTVVGLTAGALWAGSRDFAAAARTQRIGQSNSDGFVIGAYATHHAASGFYVDAVVQHDWLDHSASAADGTRADADSRTFIASLEAGYALGTSWQIEPQAQIVFASTRFDRFTDSTGVANQVSVDDSVIGRAGLRIARSFDGDDATGAGRLTLYGKGNLWHRLSGGAAMLTVGVSATGAAAFRESWSDVGLGAVYGIGPRAELFIDGEVEFGLDQSNTAVAGRTGIRLRF